MNGKHPFWLILTAALASAAVFAPGGALAADDDEVVVGPIAAQDVQQIRHFAEANFDQLMFQNVGNAQLGEQQIRTRVQLQLAELDRLCELTEPQRKKLELAAKGDVARFLQEVDVLRRKFNPAKRDENAFNQMWQDIQPLHLKQSRGLTGPGSLLVKSLGKTLTAEQAARYEEVTLERRRFRYQASIAIALHTIEASVALKHEERELITNLLLELPPPRAFGQYDHYLIMYRLAGLPPEKLQSHLDARRWAALKKQFAQYAANREFLFQQGLLTREELEQDAKRPVAEAQP